MLKTCYQHLSCLTIKMFKLQAFAAALNVQAGFLSVLTDLVYFHWIAVSVRQLQILCISVRVCRNSSCERVVLCCIICICIADCCKIWK